MSAPSMLVLVGLLLLPVAAIWQLRDYAVYLGIFLLIVNALTFWVYARDKRCARDGAWRTPEMRLHLLELLGGWPAAFFAQRQLRHKCSKGSFQVVFWAIVLLYQFISVDCVMKWKIFHSVVN